MGSFAGMEGLAQGLDAGTSIMARMQAMRQLQEQQQALMAAKRAAGSAYMAPQARPQPPMPGVASQPTRMMDMGDLELPSPDPTEMGVAPQMPPPSQSMIPSGGAPPLPPPPQPMPIPMNADGAPMAGPAPAATPPTPLGAGGDPMPTQGNDAVQGAQETIRSIAGQIKAANPGITPEALFDATGLQIEQMKGVRNDVKDYMQMQVEMAKLQTKLQVTEQTIAGRQDVADTQAGARTESAQIGADSRRDVATTQAGARTESARIAALSRMSVAEMAATAKVTTAQLGADSREAVAATNADVDRYASDQRYRAAVNTAAIEMGVKMPAGPATRQPSTWKGPAKPLAAPKAGAYKSGADVKAAFAAGKISEAEAVKILRTQFGMK